MKKRKLKKWLKINLCITVLLTSIVVYKTTYFKLYSNKYPLKENLQSNIASSKKDLIQNSQNNKPIEEIYDETKPKINSLIFVTSNSEMTDKDKLYVNIKDGNLYYHDGEKWINSGSYQSVQLEDGTIDLSKLDETVRNGIYNSEYTNLFDKTLQTSDTIEPYYYVNGFPYDKLSNYNKNWNTTALIPVEPSTQYTLGIVPSQLCAGLETSKPWGTAGNGVFFYDSNGNYIPTTAITNNTFKTTANTVYIRFNYFLNFSQLGNDLEKIMSKIVLIKGNKLPDNYYKFWKENFAINKIEELKDKIKHNFYYSINGDKISIVYKYNSKNDLVVTLDKKGGNNIFDFYNFGLIQNEFEELSNSIASSTSFNYTISDWHSPFIIQAINNIDGDSANASDFTGGNHEYTNTGSGGTSTGRTTNLKFTIDNVQRGTSEGYGNQLEIKWTNLVQGNNTKKKDGTGREIIQENHVITFDGDKWDTYVELIPLEDVFVKKWYGFQICAYNNNVYPNVRYIGGTNREEYDLSTASYSGGKTATKVIRYGKNHKIELEIDPMFDLGNMKYVTGNDSIFTLNYGKSYFNIIENQKLKANSIYALRGSYRFTSL